MSKRKLQPTNQRKSIKEKVDQKLPNDIIFEIKTCFDHYINGSKIGLNRKEAKSILTNFGFHGFTSKELDEYLASYFKSKEEKLFKNDSDFNDDRQPKKDPEYREEKLFSLDEILEIVKAKWFNQGGRFNEYEDIYKIFDKRGNGSIGLADIRNVFSQYLDFTISDQDILDYIDEVGEDGSIKYEDFVNAMR